MSVAFHWVVVWTLIALCGFEAFLGLRQLYGFASSNHSLFNLTGSFFNPGPYSGYLAMIFPICLYEWLMANPFNSFIIKANLSLLLISKLTSIIRNCAQRNSDNYSIFCNTNDAYQKKIVAR